MTAPSDVSQVEKRAYVKILGGASLRAKHVWMVEKGIADAAGLGMPMDDPSGNMIVNLGGGHTEISVISDGKVILNRVLRLGGQKLDADIISMVRHQYQLHIGTKTAEELKIHLASIGQVSWKSTEGLRHSCSDWASKGRRDFPLFSVSVSVIETIDQITEAVHAMLERTPPQLLADIQKAGILYSQEVFPSFQVLLPIWKKSLKFRFIPYRIRFPAECAALQEL